MLFSVVLSGKTGGEDLVYKRGLLLSIFHYVRWRLERSFRQLRFFIQQLLKTQFGI